MITPAILTIPTLVLPLLMSSPTRDCQFGRIGDPTADEQALARFELRVNQYMDVHRRLERAWPPPWFIADFEVRESAAEEFRAVLRDARPQATQGNFFTPDVADVFRFKIRNVLRYRDYDVAAMTSATDEETAMNDWWRPVVNEPLPLGAAGVVWPVFENLPVLPLELEYRLVGRDLVLLDVHANMVVDFLDFALPAATESVGEGTASPEIEERTVPYEEERVVPLGDEFIGCLYGTEY
jgi:hypothetical protein